MMQTEATDTQPRGNALSVTLRDDNIAVITMDTPGERVNVIQADVIDEAEALFADLATKSDLQGIVFISGKPDSFIAGADIRVLASLDSAEDVTRLSEKGQAFCQRITHFSKPVIAAIHGRCLGGGLELAMACRGRIATDDPKTQLGLPEVKLGLLPGSGGTQRLPALVGIQAALDMMLTGKQVRADKARRLGLVHDVVPRTILLEAAIKLIGQCRRGEAPPAPKRALQHWLLERNPLGRKIIFDQARKTVKARTKDNYPAAPAIIECVEIGSNQGLKQGLEMEARRFGELAMTPQARELIQVYFATVAMKKDRGTAEDVSPLPVRKVAVLGAGLMGAGISFVTAVKAKTPVRLRDISNDNLSGGMQYIDQRIHDQAKRQSMTSLQSIQALRRISPTLDWSGFGSVDLVIEAVFEDIELKHRMVREIESHCPEHTIFATNTSSIPIAEIASVAARPENIIGMHYFSPVEKMPLLEIIATEQTKPEVIATTTDFGRRQGKTPIVVKDGAGFYVNRILAPYINEATLLLEQGVAIDHIDQALVQFGFPVGPFALLDEVGLDVSGKISPILHAAFGERMKPAKTTERMLQDGRLGKKNKKGFYNYKAGKKKKGAKDVDESVYQLLGVEPKADMDSADIINRTVLLMLNEAARCLEEGVIRSTRDGDIGALFGIGFPPFRGGPFRYMNSRGITSLVKDLDSLQKTHGERYAPAEILLRMAEHGDVFKNPSDA